MKVAAIQMVSGSDVQTNLDQARDLLQTAAQSGAELAVLPEYFCLMGQRDADKLAIGEAFGSGPLQQFLSDTAGSLGLWLVGGTLPLSCPEPEAAALGAGEAARVSNSSLVFSPDGACVARYDKIHLFRFDNGRERYDESLVLKAGTEPVTFDLPSKDGHLWRVGLSVCYDLRFPELYRRMGPVDLILVPAAFTETTGRAHWELLCRARAVENQCYLIAAAQGGQHPTGRLTHGNSMIVDPWGEVLARLDKGEGVIVAEFDPARLAEVRASLPALRHRKL